MKLEIEILTIHKLQYSLFFSYKDANMQLACT